VRKMAEAGRYIKIMDDSNRECKVQLSSASPTLGEVLKKYAEMKNLNRDNFRVFCEKDELDPKESSESTLETLGIQFGSGLRVLNRESRKVKTIKGTDYELTNSIPCFITQNVDPAEYNYIMPCSHVVSIEGLKSLLDSVLIQVPDRTAKEIIFRCSAVVYTGHGSAPLCDREIPWVAIRDLCNLDDTDCKEYEEKISDAYMQRIADVKSCPTCHAYVMRDDKALWRVSCPACPKKSRKDFCWRCLKGWKGQGSKICGNEECLALFQAEGIGALNEILRTCPLDHPWGITVEVPSIRACPVCKQLIQRKDGCKHMTCSHCKTNFCFVCLKQSPKSDSASWRLVCGGYGELCPTGVAARQVLSDDDILN